MSLNDFPERNDVGWDKFVSTGNVYDYLEYRSRMNSTKSDTNSTILLDNRGGFCENRGKGNSSKGD